MNSRNLYYTTLTLRSVLCLLMQLYKSTAIYKIKLAVLVLSTLQRINDLFYPFWEYNEN